MRPGKAGNRMDTLDLRLSLDPGAPRLPHHLVASVLPQWVGGRWGLDGGAMVLRSSQDHVVDVLQLCRQDYSWRACSPASGFSPGRHGEENAQCEMRNAQFIAHWALRIAHLTLANFCNQAQNLHHQA